MKHFLFTICLSSLLSAAVAQKQDSTLLYNTQRDLAREALTNDEYARSAQLYEKAFSFFDGKAYANDRYNAACAYSLAEKIDSAFYHLFYLANQSEDYVYNNYRHIQEKDVDLENLRDHERWKELNKKMDSIKVEKEKDFDMELVNLLDSIYELDQGVRREYFDLKEQYENDSEEMQLFMSRWRETDSLNEIAISKILDERGWLGSDVISGKGNTTLFLVIQHAPLETQEKYLPMMRQAVKDGNAQGSQLALLEDRINLRNNRHQIYGSQIGSMPDSDENIVLPLKEPLKVDERRASVGLPPLASYTIRFGFEWDAEEYLKRLPELEKIFLKKDEK